VLSNLIENAVKYSPEDQPVDVSIDCEEGSNGSGSHATIKVKDRGIGIAPEDQARLFAKFFRASNAEAYQNGLGLGLFISQQIAKQHGGIISLESTPGEGTIFTLTLPIVDAATPAESREADSRATPTR
jgi:two-component system sensor histidine kinase SenX3